MNATELARDKFDALFEAHDFKNKREAAQQKQACRPEPFVSATAGMHAPECGHCGPGQQTGSHVVGGLVQERTLPRSDPCGDRLKSLFREKQFLPGLLAENRDGNGSLPRSRNLISEKVFPRPSTLYGRGRADIHHGPESMTPPKAEYIGADQLPLIIFRLQLYGGPYIPIILFIWS